jgi:putative heme-binding domain-containing protein
LREHPGLAGELAGGGEDPAAFSALLKTVPWEEGDGARGEEVFRARGCQTCHAVQGALGPALGGAARRFSRDDLFAAIAFPSRDVAPLYRPTVFHLRDGQAFTGIVVFVSADGYIVQTGATTTARIAAADVASMRPGALSLMPEGLLKGLAPRDLADLYRYLQDLK